MATPDDIDTGNDLDSELEDPNMFNVYGCAVAFSETLIFNIEVASIVEEGK
ncbi:MAG TPA: hypothetical protein VFI70_06030 [Nitrososphaeraceae archaeon]|nr:hypothetical protein [Nitrososphaeraceae archaeon]